MERGEKLPQNPNKRKRGTIVFKKKKKIRGKKKTPGCLPIPPQICHWLLYTRLHLLDDAGPEISMITSKK